MLVGAHRNQQSIEHWIEEACARAMTRCDPSQPRIVGPGLEHVDKPFTADDIDPLPSLVEETVVGVPAGVALRKRAAITRVAYIELCWRPKDDDQVMIVIVERHRKVAPSSFANGPASR